MLEGVECKEGEVESSGGEFVGVEESAGIKVVRCECIGMPSDRRDGWGGMAWMLGVSVWG